MGRQQQQQKRSSPPGTDLLNFHFTTAPTVQQQPQQQQQQRRRNQNQNYNNYQYNQRRRNPKQDRSNAAAIEARRRKQNAHMFNLHTSADHAFVITRHGLKQQPYSFSGSDVGVSWESVRMVKYLVPSTDLVETSAINCPICLDSLVCARIT